MPPARHARILPLQPLGERRMEGGSQDGFRIQKRCCSVSNVNTYGSGELLGNESP